MNERMPKERREAARKRRGQASLPGKETITYPYWMRLGVFLDRQEPKSGLSKENLEQRFFSRGAGKTDKTRVAPLPGIEVEKLSEEKLKELETNWASGLKIKYILDSDTGREEPHVLMHSLTPNLMGQGIRTVAVKEHKEGGNSPSGQRAEVNIFSISKCVLTFFMQAPAAKQVVEDPLQVLKRRSKKMEKKMQRVQTREKRRISATMKSDRNKRERARESRLDQKKERTEMKRKENEAEQCRKKSEAELQGKDRKDEQGEEMEAEQQGKDPRKSQLKKKSKKDLVDKRVRKILMAAPYGSRREKEEKKKINLGVRADRSKVIHETPLRRRGKKKSMQTLEKVLDSKVERKEGVSPSKESYQEKSISPSKDAQQQQTSPSKATIKDQPQTSSKIANHQEPQSAQTLSSDQEQEMPNVTDRSDDEEESEVVVEDVGPALCEDMAELSREAESEVEKQIVGLALLPSKYSSQEQPKSPPKPSTQERPGLPSKSTNYQVTLNSPTSNAQQWKLPAERVSHLPIMTDSSEEEGENEDRARSRIRTRVRKSVKQAKESTPPLTSSSSEEDEPTDEKLLKKITLTAMGNGDLRGGGPPVRLNQLFQEDLTMLDSLRMAIHETQLPVVIDSPTPAEGNCFSHAMIQQFQRPSVQTYLHVTGRHIATFLQLKNKVAKFVDQNKDSEKIKALRTSFELSQQSIHLEGVPDLQRRSWKQYWEDMTKDGEWADDTFIQATALYVNMDILIIFAAQATRERLFGRIDGNFVTHGTATDRPPLLVGYINTSRNNEHYQSLLPVEEANISSRVQIPSTMDHVMRKVLETLRREERKAKEKEKILASSSLDNVLLKVLKAIQGQTEVSFAFNFFPSPNSSFTNETNHSKCTLFISANANSHLPENE